jgi:predicted DNA-binding protein with PD1-like motif
MRSKLLHEERGEKTFAVVFDKGEEVMAVMQEFAAAHAVSAATLSGVGAFSDVVLGYFQPQQRRYRQIPIREQVELLAFNGNIGVKDGKPKVHSHVVVGKSDGTAHGGHLLEAHVWPTLELIVVESPRHLRRKIDEETGLALIDLAA